MNQQKPTPVLTLLLATLLLCGAAFYNGYPLVYPDTGGYLGLHGTSFRSFFYNLFLWPTLGLHSLWPAVFLQSLITVHLLRLILRTVFGLASPWSLPLTVAPLCLLSNLAWFTGFIMPDIFTGVLILAFFLLFFCAPRLGRGEQLYLTALAVVAITVHLSHLPLALGLLLIGGLWKLVARRLPASLPPPALARGVWAFVIALTLLLANGYRTYGRPTIAPGGYAFLLARLVADGPAVRYLREQCPEKQYALCDYLDQLPADFDAFMWAADSPFRKVGWIDGYRQEGREIVFGTVCRYPVEVGRLVVRNTLRQLFMFNNWYGIAPFRDVPYPTSDIKAHFPPAEFQAYAGCRQNENTLGLKWFNLLHVAVIAFCVPLAGALWVFFRRRRQFLPALFLGALAIAYGLSAFVTAALSGPHNRYGSRLIWLLPFFCIAAVLQLIRERRRHA